MRVLYIEDSKELAINTKTQLENLGFTVDISFDGLDGEEKAFVNDYDVLLIDINLPYKSGTSLLDFLRREGVKTPAIFITANDEVSSRVKALDMGADDYITKPFDINELRARIHAIIRRANGISNPEIVLGDLRITPSNREVFIRGKLMELSPKEYDILEFLALKHPIICSTEKISEHVYDEFSDPFSSVLRVHISRVKQKVNKKVGYDFIINIRGKGYKICQTK